MTAVIGAPKPTPPLKLTGVARDRRDGLIWAREQGRCALCGRAIRIEYSIHHRRFLSRRGGDEVSNGVLVCGSGTTGCHGWIHANPAAAASIGFAVSSTADPRSVAVRHSLYGVVTFDDDGRCLGTSQTRSSEVEIAYRQVARERAAQRRTR